MKWSRCGCWMAAGLVLVLGAPAMGERPTFLFEADDNLSDDMTSQIQSFIDGVPDGSTIAFRDNAQYRIEGTLEVSGRNDLIIEGNAALFRSFDPMPDDGGSATRNRPHWSVVNGSDGITLRNMTVWGPNDAGGTGDEAWDASREAQHAFNLDASSNLLVEGVEARNIFGDGVYIRSDHVVVRDSVIHHNGRQGIAPVRGTDILIENNHIHDIRRGMIDLEPASVNWAVSNVRIIGNTFGDNRLAWIPSAGRGEVTHIFIADNVLEVPISGMNVSPSSRAEERRGPFILVNNELLRRGGSSAGAHRFSETDGVFASGNDIPLPPAREMYGFRFSDTEGAMVTGNNLTGSAGAINPSGHDAEKSFDIANESRGVAEWLDEDGALGARVLDELGGLSIAVMRGGSELSDDPIISAYDLSTDAEMAMIYLSAENEILYWHVHGAGTAWYQGVVVPEPASAGLLGLAGLLLLRRRGRLTAGRTLRLGDAEKSAGCCR